MINTQKKTSFCLKNRHCVNTYQIRQPMYVLDLLLAFVLISMLLMDISFSCSLPSSPSRWRGVTRF